MELFRVNIAPIKVEVGQTFVVCYPVELHAELVVVPLNVARHPRVVIFAALISPFAHFYPKLSFLHHLSCY